MNSVYENRALSYLFTPKVLNDFFNNNTSELLASIFDEFNFFNRIDQSVTLRDFFENSYKHLLKSYRNEYIFKNAIVKKVLIGKHSLKSSSLFTEFRVATSKADVVILNGTSHVYEIKTELDSLERLKSQIDNYKKVFENVNVVTVESKVDTIRNLLDDTIGIIILTDKYTLRTVRKARSGLYNLDKGYLFDILRRDEYLEILLKINDFLPDLPNTKIYSACKKIFTQLPIEIIHKELLRVLKNRKSYTNIINTIKDFPESLKVAILEADLSTVQQQHFLNLLNQRIDSVFIKGG